MAKSINIFPTSRIQMKRIPHLAVIVLLTTPLPSLASAQYVWLDDKGTKQFSDMPPPVSVPASRILKQPGRSASSPPADAAVPEAEKPTTGSRADVSLADRNADFKKRKADQAEKEKKAEEEAKQAAEKSKNCDRAREYYRTLAAGERIVRTDKNGERAFLTDEQRNQEIRDARRIIEDCK